MRNFNFQISYYSSEPEYVQPKKKKSSKHDEIMARVERTVSMCLGEELLQAAQQSDVDKVRSLLQRGAYLRIKNEAGWTAMHWAAVNGNTEIGRMLLEKGADVNERDNAGWTPHLWSTTYGHTLITRVFIERGADPNFADKDGWSPLIYAARYGHLDIGRNLLEWGAKMNHEDQYGWTALMRAIYYEHNEFAKMLIERGADVNRRSSKAQSWLGIGVGWTALMIAANKCTKPFLVNLLLANGARLEYENEHNNTAIDVATEKTIQNILQNAPPTSRYRPITI